MKKTSLYTLAALFVAVMTFFAFEDAMTPKQEQEVKIDEAIAEKVNEFIAEKVAECEEKAFQVAMVEADSMYAADKAMATKVRKPSTKPRPRPKPTTTAPPPTTTPTPTPPPVVAPKPTEPVKQPTLGKGQGKPATTTDKPTLGKGKGGTTTTEEKPADKKPTLGKGKGSPN